MSTIMKNVFVKSLSLLLALMTVVTLLVSLSMYPVFADDTSSGDSGTVSTTELSYEELYKYYYIEGIDYTNSEDGEPVDFTTDEKRIAAMTLYLTQGDFELYVDEITGEVAVKDTSTGDVIFTNPYDISSTSYYESVKMELMSQVYIKYTDNGTEKEYYSFEDSALLGQIDVKRLRGGIRIEYSIGEEESRTLVPRLIEKSRFEELIYYKMAESFEKGVDERKVMRLRGFYTLFDPNSSTNTTAILTQMYNDFPVTKDGMAVYAFDENATMREIKLIESYIKEYCPDYTYEELDYDHDLTNYESTTLAPANFRMALEYYLNDSGVEVRFPANGLRFDESAFQLSSISVLMYMGAGNNTYNGFTLIPDGSGALIRYEDVSSALNLTGKLYGQDYAYQEIGNANQEVYRMPVFGTVTSNVLQDGKTVEEGLEKTYSSGYIAIVTEGDALTSITTTHGGDVIHCYNSCYCTFEPRPKDSYNLAEAISIGSNTTYTVVSERKYTGSYRIQYIMLTDPDNTENRTAGRTYYDTTYVGMAKAYRDYLISQGSLVKLTEDDVNDDIPLYIENFGVIETDETVLSIPITVKVALTSFDNLKTMFEELKAAGISNLNFRLVGFTNGGMTSTVPTKVKFEKATGGKKGFTAFLEYAMENDIGVYPDFDFAYQSSTSLFDGFQYKRDAVKSIDNRYIQKRTYDAILQTFTNTGKICISSSVYRNYFEKFSKSFNKLVGDRTVGISVGTLGSDLNTDFDDDDPYNREDSKSFTSEMLAQLKNAYGSVMIDAGNAYAIPYADVILNVSLDSSRYLNASEAIPFFGMVYHGSVVFAGTPTNMAGDINYEVLKIIENGATLYMMLSYENVELLKEDPKLSEYYAISYEFWKESLLSQYDEAGNLVSLGLYDKLNNALKDVQTSLINDHQFLSANRVLSQTELVGIEEDATVAYKEAYNKYDVLYVNAQNKLNDYHKLVNIYGSTSKEFKEACEAYGYTATGSLTIEETLTAMIEQYKTQRDAIKYETYYQAEYNKIDTFIDDGSIVYVEYDNGHWFILNYNDYDAIVTSPVDGETLITVGAMSFYDSNAND